MCMKNMAFLMAFLLSSLPTAWAQSQNTPTATPLAGINLDQLKTYLRTYAQKAYPQAQEQVIHQAQTFIQETIRKKKAKNARYAVVLDIDETSLSNLDSMLANDFAYIKHGPCHIPQGPCSWNAWKSSLKAHAIAPTLAFFNSMQHLGIQVFFVTGRREEDRNITRQNLEKAGFKHWADLIMRPNDQQGKVGIYKAEARRHIQEKNYIILANIGDQESDLTGGYAQKTFKMPNPFYLID